MVDIELLEPQKLLSLPLPVPKEIPHPPLQKIDFDLIKKEASKIHALQQETIEQKFKSDPKWRLKEFIKYIVTSLIMMLVAIGIMLLSGGSGGGAAAGGIIGLIILFYGSNGFFKAIKEFFYQKAQPLSIEAIELLLYKNMLHVTSLTNINNEKFISLGFLSSSLNNEKGIPEDLVQEAYSLRADALIAFSTNHSVSSNTYSSVTTKTVKTDTKHHYHTTTTAVKLQ
ncbi:hypothetical protein [Sulfurospirillum oryzae]|uniref:hypothetical protein n=1 Tax=Sulfurospirillum oryzae TaxID=2976535 RepID=UPI0021E8AA20|nr:hypothetical protein [Sulfurospirillum oryzae]